MFADNLAVTRVNRISARIFSSHNHNRSLSSQVLCVPCVQCTLLDTFLFSAGNHALPLYLPYFFNCSFKSLKTRWKINKEEHVKGCPQKVIITAALTRSFCPPIHFHVQLKESGFLKNYVFKELKSFSKTQANLTLIEHHCEHFCWLSWGKYIANC